MERWSFVVYCTKCAIVYMDILGNEQYDEAVSTRFCDLLFQVNFLPVLFIFAPVRVWQLVAYGRRFDGNC